MSEVSSKVAPDPGRNAPPIERRHIMAFDLNAYETVAERLQRAHSDHADLRIITEIVDIVRDPSTLRPLQYIVKASVYYGDILKAVDYAEEMVGSSPVNKYSALENCSTSAAGRALSMAGYLGVDPNSKKPTRPTRNEMEKVERAKTAEAKPALVVKVPTPEEIAKAASLIPTVAHITTKAELKDLYNENASILEVRVDGVTLLDAINKRLVQL
jgi:hypothetical protein